MKAKRADELAHQESVKRAREALRRREFEKPEMPDYEASAKYHRMAPRFVLHHEKLHPYEAIELIDNGEHWRILIAKGWHINLPKKLIVRIEPIDCPTDYRTWVDASGSFSIVGKIDRIKKPYIRLAQLDGKATSIHADKLSDVDQRFLRDLLSGSRNLAPRYFRERKIDQVAKVHRFCIVDGVASAEVAKTTSGNRRLDDEQWEYPKRITIASPGSIDSLVSGAFPEAIWEEIEADKYQELEASFRF